MKYKIGDKVKIKTWGELEKEYGLNEDEDINCKYGFTKNTEIEIKKLNCNRILTIDKVRDYSYGMKEIKRNWSNDFSDDMIKCLAKDDIKSEPITSRFEILDIR